MKLRNNKTFIILGVVLIGLGVFGMLFPAIYGLLVNDVLPLQDAMAEVPTFEDQFINSENEFPAAGDKTLEPTPDYELLEIDNRLIIPRAKINMPVFLGNNEKILNKGGWLFPTNSRPELEGNSVIFGHRYKYLPPISNTLYNLDKVNIGDEMIFTWQGKEYRYKVFEKKIIESTDLSVIQPTKDSRLTVITCTPLFTTKQRLVIVGSLMP